MNEDSGKKIAVDVAMFVAIILEFVSLPIMAHQLIGIGLVALIAVHIKFNEKYFRAIPKGKYNFKRAFDLIVNIGLLISLGVTIVSGIFCSMKGFKGMKVGKYKMSHIHKTSAVVSLVFLALHLFTTHKKLFREVKKLLN